MKKLALSFVLLAALGSNAAFADTTATTTTTAKPAVMKPAAPLTATGAIVAVDPKACTVTLDKTAYHFGAHCKISKLKVGEKVTITYKVVKTVDWVTKIVKATA